MGTAWAEIATAAAAAISRTVAPVGGANRVNSPRAVAVHHLESVLHRLAEDAATTRHGLTSSRTAAGASSESP